jgi:hypothetical protein
MAVNAAHDIVKLNQHLSKTRPMYFHVMGRVINIHVGGERRRYVVDIIIIIIPTIDPFFHHSAMAQAISHVL